MDILIFILILPLAFLPTIISIKKNHPHKIPIILINIVISFFGFFGIIFWIAVLIWSFIPPKGSQGLQPGAAAEIEKLHDLKSKGILSEDEYELKKKELLS